VNELRQSVGRDDAPILIDQEGGRVSRLQPPNWNKYPPARYFGTMYEKDPELGAAAIQVYARLVANELRRMGITVNCAPVVDLFVDGASNAIGDRAISRKPAVVAALARRLAETFLANGVMPVIKHIPGHGRLNVDPHVVSPVINASRAELESDDFEPFVLLKDLPAAMNSHAIFTALDPDSPASLSAKIHHEVIRGTIGFGGLIFSDDIVMKALYGSAAERAKGVLKAGADVALHCNGKLEEMEEIAASLNPMNDESWAHWEHAKSMVKTPEAPYNSAADSAELDVLLGGLAYQAKSVG
jgi:beta-N-acetylhexosaminidase